MKIAAIAFTGMLTAGALLVTRAGAAQGPDLDLMAKTTAKEQAPAPVTAPLSVGTAFNASLLEALDTRHAKPGDAITAEVAENVTYERTIVFAKGTKVVGHIVRATSGGHGRAGSALFVQFDKAVLKDGQVVRLVEIVQQVGASGLVSLAGWAGMQEEKEDQYSSERTHKVDGRIVHEKISKTSGTNEFGIVLGDRFVVSARGEAVDLNDLRNAVGAMDLVKLESLKDVGVQK